MGRGEQEGVTARASCSCCGCCGCGWGAELVVDPSGSVGEGLPAGGVDTGVSMDG
jgi:hypothetical protein